MLSYTLSQDCIPPLQLGQRLARLGHGQTEMHQSQDRRRVHHNWVSARSPAIIHKHDRCKAALRAALRAARNMSLNLCETKQRRSQRTCRGLASYPVPEEAACHKQVISALLTDHA